MSQPFGGVARQSGFVRPDFMAFSQSSPTKLTTNSRPFSCASASTHVTEGGMQKVLPSLGEVNPLVDLRHAVRHLLQDISSVI